MKGKKKFKIIAENFRINNNNIIPEDLNYRNTHKFKKRFLNENNEFDRVEYYLAESDVEPAVIEHFNYYRDSNGVLEQVSVTSNWLTVSGSTGYSETNLYTGDTTNEIVDNSQYFDAYDSSSKKNITYGWVDVPFDSIRKKDGIYTHTLDDADIYVGLKSLYIITGRVSVQANKSNSVSQIRLMHDDGNGYEEVPGCRTWVSGVRGTGHIHLALELNIGDKIKLQAKKEYGNGYAKLLENGSSLTIIKHG